jgi:DNA-binding CsgD family transcriptional regulator/tetratricopeptide (TPR) repeat protein
MSDLLWPLAARDAQLDAIASALRAGAGLVSVHGAPGSGRSRVLDEAASAAERVGMTVLRIRANPLLQHLPLGALGPLLTDRSALEPHADAARLFDLASMRAAALAGRTELLVVIDDIAHLDVASLTLVAQLAASGRCSLLVSAADATPLPGALLALGSSARSVRVELTPLGLDAVHALLEAALGDRIARASAERLHGLAGGNLLHLRELVSGAIADGSLRRVEGGWRLVREPGAPSSLRDLVLARVETLDAEQRDAVERLAVCVEIPVCELPTSDQALESLERDGLVTLATTSTGLVARLAQPVYGSAIASAITRLRRTRILDEQSTRVDAGSVHVADRLRALSWRIAAGLPLDAGTARSAARVAREVGDHRMVLELADAGLRSGRDAELVLLRGEALLRLGRVGEALDALQSAENAVPPELLPTFAAVMAIAHANRFRGRPDGLRLVEEVAERIEGEDRLLLAMTRALILVNAEHAEAAGRQLREVADAIASDPQSRALLAAAEAIPLSATGRFEEGLAAARLAVDYAEQTGGRVPGLTVTEAQQLLAEVLINAFRLREAKAAALAALEAAGAGDELIARGLEWLLGRIAFFSGELDDAARWLDDTRSGAAALGPEGLAVPSTALLAMTYASKGDTERARRILGSLGDDGGEDDTSAPRSARLWIQGCTGDVDGAVEGMLAWIETLRARGHLVFTGGMLTLLVELDRADVAAPIAREIASASSGWFIGLLADHAEAVVAGDATALLAVADEWERLGALRYAAAACASAARARRAQGSARGAAAAQARAEELARRCGGLATPVLRFVDELSPLTRREREIAALAASGASSKVIAARLSLSSRTVDNHLQSVYGKLGIRGRRELAALASEWRGTDAALVSAR